jgi:hypothetical protein
VGNNFLFAVESVKKNFRNKVYGFFLPAEKFSRIFLLAAKTFFGFKKKVNQVRCVENDHSLALPESRNSLVEA